MSLNAVRQALLTAVVGSPFFSSEEQIEINSAAWGTEDEGVLTVRLGAVRRKAARRAQQLVNPTLAAAGKKVQKAEFERVLSGAALDLDLRDNMQWRWFRDQASPDRRVALLAQAHLLATAAPGN